MMKPLIKCPDCMMANKFDVAVSGTHTINCQEETISRNPNYSFVGASICRCLDCGYSAPLYEFRRAAGGRFGYHKWEKIEFRLTKDDSWQSGVVFKLDSKSAITVIDEDGKMVEISKFSNLRKLDFDD